MGVLQEGKRPTFSVIIPARNEERNIERCLASLAALSWPAGDFEVLVIDNGSTDRTVELAAQWQARVLVRPGCTVSALRNLGAAHSRGAVLSFLDADCTVTPDWLHQAARYLQLPGIVCFGNPPVIPEQSTWVQRAWFQVRRKRGVSETPWLESMNMFVRREAFERAGGFNTALVTCEDYDLSLRLGGLGKIISDDAIVAVHHGEAASLAHFFRKEHWRALGNLRGMLSHSFRWQELPSVVVPIAYCLLAALGAALLICGQLLPEAARGPLLALLVALWQLPLALLALRKSGGSAGVMAASQLFVLLNVYFLARGLASLRWR